MGLALLALAGECRAESPWASPADSWRVNVAAVTEGSLWSEFASDGRQLLRERGRLDGPALHISGRLVGPWDLQVELARLEGQRGYHGTTSRGQPVQTRVDAATERVAAQVDHRWAAWSVGLRLERTEHLRNIMGVGTIFGLDERYRWSSALLDLSHRSSPSETLQTGVGVRAGRHLGGTVSLTLPGADLTRAPTARGPVAQARAVMIWKPAVSSGFPPLVGVISAEAERHVWSAGGDGEVVRNGVVTGIVRQPRTDASRWGLSAGVGWTW